MNTYTDKEIEMLKVFIGTSVDCCGGCSDEENMSYNNAQDLAEILGWSLQSVGGVMISLMRKGAIVDCGESTRGALINDFVVDTKPEILALASI